MTSTSGNVQVIDIVELEVGCGGMHWSEHKHSVFIELRILFPAIVRRKAQGTSLKSTST